MRGVRADASAALRSLHPGALGARALPTTERLAEKEMALWSEWREVEGTAEAKMMSEVPAPTYSRMFGR